MYQKKQAVVLWRCARIGRIAVCEDAQAWYLSSLARLDVFQLRRTFSAQAHIPLPRS